MRPGIGVRRLRVPFGVGLLKDVDYDEDALPVSGTTFSSPPLPCPKGLHVVLRESHILIMK